MSIITRTYCLFNNFDIEISLPEWHWGYLDGWQGLGCSPQNFIENSYIYKREQDNFNDVLAGRLVCLYYECEDDHFYVQRSLFCKPPTNHRY